MAINSLQDLMVQGLEELYSAEQLALQAYPQMLQMVSAPELKQGLEAHMQQTQQQVQRLEQLFQQLGQTPGQTQNRVMQGIIENGQKIVSQINDPVVRDAALIAGAQIIEHYEIAGYGTARTYAQTLGMNDAAQLLEQTLQEEKQTDDQLTQVAQQSVNQQAKQAGQ